MRLLKRKTRIDFMGKRHVAMVLSAILLTAAIVSLPMRGLNFGLDFTGGTLIEVSYPSAPDLLEVRESLAAAGLDDAQVQTFGAANDIVVRIPPGAAGESSAEISTRVLTALGSVEMRRVEFVGPQVGEELTEQGILAVLYALIGIFIYVMFRFQWRFSVGAVAALVHDVLITMGVLSMLQVEFDLTVVAALLAVVGYSLNDTIVLFDRIRENFPRLGKHTSIDVINTSVNETLSRTVMTSLTTLLVLSALFYFGGEIIHAFALTLIVGVLIGTYSSIYVASTTLLLLRVSKYDLLVVEKEGAKLADNRP
ncbi:MAG: protein translocase subunit SecF [Xanthomonadales bacterium]|uniref:protein translocase subunit SecF n=1 Tax=Hydrogenophaga sp. TaxID=1904254 RepID=UPI0016B78B30|nr:protein translocase subunit SecF [Hydrogenophaga sp.]NIM70695.1 protein translocase subunit SecF [Xanthomonadales bacterium]NIN33450.1 protein translocase subunit SecF [Hydrogenophaga sp.]NIN59972.1 protein translocase subunit SecF [Xanthomonadales bacterium]NIN75345.1 protein translocase subunit SecF [Xanthomonadales bacterium]NIO13514.1 protein translocase subunit SecF [Xanthomonadales bacterium]